MTTPHGVTVLLHALMHAVENGDIEDDLDWITAFIREIPPVPASRRP